MAPKAVIRRPARAPASLITAAAVKIKEKAKEAKRRQDLYQSRSSSLLPSQGGISLLEKICALESVEDDYYKRAGIFQEWLVDNQLAPRNAREVAMCLLEILDHLFLDGAGHPDGSKLLSAVLHIYPELREATVEEKRVRRALSGWQKRAPAETRVGIPDEVVYAQIGMLLSEGMVLQALCLGMQLNTYFRPGENFVIRVKDVIRPTANKPEVGLVLAPSETMSITKTGKSDESVQINGHKAEWISKGLLELCTGRPGHEQLFPFLQEEFTTSFHRSLHLLSLGSYHFSPYSVRHAGPSNDFLHHRRDLADIKNRGRWKSDSSVRRYTKATKLQQLAQEINPRVTNYGTAVMANIDEIMAGRAELPIY